ncbi:hypothetical protein HBA55_32335 [Pseudomaricurvus alkylphenolicus]|jgi:hypothetical protein|uniref:3TM-type holin n=1 Tax=Pseudomaricurvus alkylphenolicus TaxID=1306991 RepID=UPI00141FB241|nr:3TM-type holin [Pseudomaricurvus alkylphenolicus]NIB44329.1 hypothetical protein [Pseudomaricurvus alkylphenolicus]
MSPLAFISDIFAPAAKLIDDVHTSTEEKGEIRAKIKALDLEIKKIETEFRTTVIDYETKLMENQSKIIQAEATGQSWIQRNWRPLTMLTFVGLIVLFALGVIELKDEFAKEFMRLVQIGLGGYVAGRSAEKIFRDRRLSAGKEEGAVG